MAEGTMNERIQELLLLSKNPNTGMMEEEKFAKLIVLECARVVKASSPQGMIGVNAIRIHFGVEP
jgi:hypothetical protein